MSLFCLSTASCIEGANIVSRESLFLIVLETEFKILQYLSALNEHYKKYEQNLFSNQILHCGV